MKKKREKMVYLHVLGPIDLGGPNWHKISWSAGWSSRYGFHNYLVPQKEAEARAYQFGWIIGDCWAYEDNDD